MHPLLDFKLENNSMNSSIKEESSRSHQEIVSMLSNPKIRFSDASSIKYMNSMDGSVPKPKFENLDGMWYDLISAFIGDKFPKFIFANKQIWNTYLEFQLEINEEVLNALNDRINQSQAYSLSSLSQADTRNTNDAINKLKTKKTIFSITDSSHEKFIESIQHDTIKLMEILSNYSLKPKDIVVMKLYFSFMGRKYSEKHDNLFMRQTHRFLYENRH